MDALTLTGVLQDGQGRVVAERNSPADAPAAAPCGSFGVGVSCVINFYVDSDYWPINLAQSMVCGAELRSRTVMMSINPNKKTNPIT